jgi:two-component system response regulator YesN
MYRVIIVDDEPAAIRHIDSIIRKKCPEYEVIDIAENGKEALEKVRLKRPDVVISDVKMPLMSGLQLAAAISEEKLPVYSVIVSGYQEFEYARSAIRAGVCDYIIKPIMPGALKEILDQISVKLKQYYYREKNVIIRKLCNSSPCTREELERCFPYKQYYRAMIRRNGLPRRFASSGSSLEIYSDINEQMTIYGRDEMESLYLLPEELLLGNRFRDLIWGVKEKQVAKNQYITVVCDSRGFPREQMAGKVKELYHILDAVSVVGLDQFMDIADRGPIRETVFNHDEILCELRNIEKLAREQQYGKLKGELEQLYYVWGRKEKPQLWVEHVSRQILDIMHKYSDKTNDLTASEHMLEDAFYYATSFQSLQDSLFDAFFIATQKTDAQIKADSQEFFDGIVQYLNEHAFENITLSELCLRFGLSQTYMSRLFQKYVKVTFNRYVTGIRMEKAIEYIKSHKDCYIKDIAEMVGYEDQFYFSRLFRSYTGKCPTEYMEQLGGT